MEKKASLVSLKFVPKRIFYEMLIRSEVERQLAVIFFAVIPLARLEGVTIFFQQFASIMKNKAGQSGQWPLPHKSKIAALVCRRSNY